MDLVGQRSALTRQLEEGRAEISIKKGLLEGVRGDRKSYYWTWKKNTVLGIGCVTYVLG
jgi:hypothetical protein